MTECSKYLYSVPQEYIMTEYLRMNGMYWGLTAMALTDQLGRMDRAEVMAFVTACQTEAGGVACSVGHDPHMLSTLSAVQILTLYDAVDALNLDSLVSWVSGLQQDDGSFYGDKWGEVDTRFSFCAVACLSLVGRLDAIKVDKAVDFVLSCMNFDGGFGCRPGSESHSGQIYCCVGLLAVTDHLHKVNADHLGWWLCERQLPSGGLNDHLGWWLCERQLPSGGLNGVWCGVWCGVGWCGVVWCVVWCGVVYADHLGWWLCERQLPSGGLNGRPEKLPDVCYSWWVLASMAIIRRLHWIDKDKLRAFMLACQDEETGGFADRPGDMVDPFHTLFGLAGLSLLGDPSVQPVNPVYCMPESIIRRLHLSIFEDDDDS
ncbi:hypothetical protein ACOMHN_030108 [Nucella lapillus]